MSTHKDTQTFLRQLFGPKADPAYEPAKDDNPETQMRKFTHRIFNRDID